MDFITIDVETADAVRSIVIDIVSETAKKVIWGK
jgi:hypothetical protein